MGNPFVPPTPQQTLAQIMREMWDEAKRAYSYPPQVHFEDRRVQPPSGLYITQDDYLAVTVIPDKSTYSLVITARVLTPGGQVIPQNFSISNPTLAIKNTSIYQLCEGYLLDVTISTSSTGVLRGECWVLAALQRGSAAGQPPYDTLISDYVTSSSNVVWPGGTIKQSVEGPGRILSTASAIPAAGAEFLLTVPAGLRWRILSGYVTLTASAAVGTRQNHLFVDDGANIVFKRGGYGGVAPATANFFGYAPGTGDDNTADGDAILALPQELTLLAGWRIGSITLGIDAADQYSALRLSVEQWIEL